MEQPSILLIDDDIAVKNIVMAALNPLVRLEYASSFNEAKIKMKVNNYTLVMLDIFINEENGIELAEFHQFESFLNLNRTILITSDINIENEIKAHSLGIRDFIKKPFNVKLLRTILDKHISHILKSKKMSVHIGPFFLDFLKHDAFIINENSKKRLDLTQKEYSILKLLLENQGMVFSRDNIFDKLWNSKSDSMSRTIDMHISSLRKKISPYSTAIKNKRSLGYYLEFEN